MRSFMAGIRGSRRCRALASPQLNYNHPGPNRNTAAMGSQWDNFLANLGEWRGSFTTLNADGEIGASTASILTLERGEQEGLVHFRLRRFGPGDEGGVPSREVNQEYRSLGRQVVFFDSGSFSKGSLQVAPGTAFGAEFGFIAGDRRHRLVQLHNPAGSLESLVLIREFRAGSGASERPALQLETLLGPWTGQMATITADWPEPEVAACAVQIEGGPGRPFQIRSQSGAEVGANGGADQRLLLQPDAGYSLAPVQVSHRHAFAVEAGWMPEPDRLERLIRRYDTSGAWLSSSHFSLTRGMGASG